MTSHHNDPITRGVRLSIISAIRKHPAGEEVAAGIIENDECLEAILEWVEFHPATFSSSLKREVDDLLQPANWKTVEPWRRPNEAKVWTPWTQHEDNVVLARLSGCESEDWDETLRLLPGRSEEAIKGRYADSLQPHGSRGFHSNLRKMLHDHPVVMSWVSDTHFKIHDCERLSREILPMCMQIDSYESFRRQLSRSSFKVERSGTYEGAYTKADFTRIRPVREKAVAVPPPKAPHWTQDFGTSTDRSFAAWSKEEDAIVMVSCGGGDTGWNAIARGLPGRTPGDVRARYLDYLQPDGPWTQEEEDILAKQVSRGSSIRVVAALLPMHSITAVRAAKKKYVEQNPPTITTTPSGARSRGQGGRRIVWTDEEDAILIAGYNAPGGPSWSAIAQQLPRRSVHALKTRYYTFSASKRRGLWAVSQLL